ncbi:MAG TPA: 2OG-Fe(II) oxygenase [Candidatus Dormibacteraeota bacterium]|jgi:hypothetical protein|nr:2OG-Fe(II) oxygenase [Candidatus Dormibacteraeota bacterium]
MSAAAAITGRIADLDWGGVAEQLDDHGCAVLPSLLAPGECRALAGTYTDDERFRSRIVMAAHGFGRGEYRYFAHPLPEPVTRLRTGLYPHLAAIANAWSRQLDDGQSYPEDLDEFLDRCHRAGQVRPTPLLLRYEAGDYNHLHQDVYGEHVFPLQVAVLLSVPGSDFTGGEFVLTEQRPRQQSRAEVVALGQGDGVLFPVRQRPVRGARGFYRAGMRHGVSRLHGGGRLTLGVVFHDAR